MNNLSFDYFLENFSRTWKYEKHTDEINLKLHLLHAVTGLVSEISELQEAVLKNDSINRSEEVGDHLYYLTMYLHFRGYTQYPERGADRTLPKTVNVDLLYRKVSQLTDICKKMCFYDKEPDFTKEYGILGDIFGILKSIDDVEASGEKVVKKLKLRYPDKFNIENAINRDLDKERKVLES